MRVNVYAEEMTERVEIISKEIDGHTYTGLRLYLYVPTTLPGAVANSKTPFLVPTTPLSDGTLPYVQGPFIHRPGDDDSAAITFWGKRDLRTVLRKMLTELDAHYGDTDARGPIISLTGAELRDAVAFIAPEDDPDQLETVACIQYDKKGHSGPGYYCWSGDYPEEGGILLGSS